MVIAEVKKSKWIIKKEGNISPLSLLYSIWLQMIINAKNYASFSPIRYFIQLIIYISYF